MVVNSWCYFINFRWFCHVIWSKCGHVTKFRHFTKFPHATNYFVIFEIHLKWRTGFSPTSGFWNFKATCFRSKVMCHWGLPESLFIPVLNHFLNTKSVTKTGKFSVTKSWISRERHVLESKFKKHIEFNLHYLYDAIIFFIKILIWNFCWSA